MAESSERPVVAVEDLGVTEGTSELVSAVEARVTDPRGGIERIHGLMRAAGESVVPTPRRPCARCSGAGYEVNQNGFGTHHCRDCHGRGTVVDEEGLRAQLNAAAVRIEACHAARQDVIRLARALVPELERWYGSENADALIVAVAELDRVEAEGSAGSR